MNAELDHPRPGLRLEAGLRSGKALGDCCQDLTHLIGADRVADLYTQLTGKDCGCEGRKQALNRLVPNFR